MSKVAYGNLTENLGSNFWKEFDRVCARQPNKIAVRSDQASYTYEELRGAAVTLAQSLVSKGARAGDSVGFFFWHGERNVVATLAATAIGAHFVPIDPGDPIGHVERIISNCTLKIIICSRNTRDRLAHLSTLVTFVLIDDISNSISDENNTVGRDHSNSTIAYILHTSGSTGLPKGVIISHASWTHYCMCVISMLDIREHDKILLGASYTFDISVMEIGIALLSGAEIVVPSVKQQKHAPSLSKLIESSGVTVCFLTQRLALQIPIEAAATIRALIVGGERVIAKTVKKWSSATRTVLNIYGPTEATVAPIFKFCDPNRDADPPVGLPMDNHYLFLVDPEDRTRIVDEGVGEIVIGGIGVALGYKMLEPLENGPFSHFHDVKPGFNAKIYFTGDQGYWDDAGNMIFVGRSDQQVKLNGVRVELGEIEEILNRHDDIEIAVVTIDHSEPGTQKLKLFAKLAIGASEISQYSAYMLQRLPPYKIPSLITYVKDFEYTKSGKLVRP